MAAAVSVPSPSAPRTPLAPRAAALHRGCHSLVVRTARPVDATMAQERLVRAVADRIGPRAPRLWTLRAGVDSGDPAGAHRVRAEAGRPVRPAGPPLRVVLVQYTDGAADLVLVAVRDRVPRAVLEQLAALLLDDPERTAEAPFGPLPAPTPPPQTVDARPAPEWGLGTPARSGAFHRVPFRLPAPGPTVQGAGTHSGEALAVAAVSLALAHYGGRPEVRLDITSALALPGVPSGRVLTVDEDDTVAAHLDNCRTDQPGSTTADGVTPEPAGVPLFLGQARPGVRYLPFLAPPEPLALHIEEQPDGSATGLCWFDEGYIAHEVGAMFADRIAHFAAQLVRLPADGPLSAASVLSAAEATEILHLGGLGSEVAPPPPGAGATIHGRISAMARERPDSVALTDGSTQLTYRLLEERAQAMAHGLATLDTHSGRVGVCLDHDATLVVSLLAVLKAGCAYAPIDSRYPRERMRNTATDAGVQVVIADPDRFPPLDGVRVISPKELEGLGTDLPTTPSSTTSASADDGTSTAYVIYTSGSTGRPKGVVVPHRNVLALMDTTAPELGFAPTDVWTLFHSSAFDFSVWEIWGALLTGGRLVVVPYWVTRAPDEFHELLAGEQVTVLSQTPSAFRQLVEADRQSAVPGGLALRLVVFGGEPLDVVLLAPWFTRYSPSRCRLVNMFGITETTVHVTAQTVTPADVINRSRSVGRALPGWAVSIRDPRGRILPPGIAGEIHVSGAGVADRYLGRPDLTAQRFLDDPRTGQRVYRSGDLGRLRPDGRLDHLGRIDNQVKVRGHRIELDEIRAVLLADPGVEAAAVVVRQETPGDPASSRIDAYVVFGTAGTVTEALRAARRVLPDYMVPATVTPVQELPLTLNGKLDTAALPSSRLAPRPQSAPDTEKPGEREAGDALAGTILRLWTELLGVPVRTGDNFFELGGNSLLVVRVLSELRSRGLPKVTTRQFYSNSSADRFIDLIRGLVEEAAATTQGDS